MDIKESLMLVKTKIVSEILGKYGKNFDEMDREEINYILNLINHALFDISNTEKIKMLYIEVDGLGQLNRLEKTLKKEFSKDVKELSDIIKEMLNNKGKAHD